MMELKVIWSESAESRLDDIFDYYLKKVGETIAKKLVNGIINHSKSLKGKPYIGQSEDLLSDRSESYRCLVFKNYKIIYSISENQGFIKIADVFDTRQDPIKLKTMD